jgi:hypothetical protein
LEKVKTNKYALPVQLYLKNNWTQL